MPAEPYGFFVFVKIVIATNLLIVSYSFVYTEDSHQLTSMLSGFLRITLHYSRVFLQKSCKRPLNIGSKLAWPWMIVGDKSKLPKHIHDHYLKSLPTPRHAHHH